MKTLGEVLKRRREALGISQRELARRLGVKASHVGYLENGRRRPSLSLLGRLAEQLKLEREPLLLLAHPEAAGLLGDRPKNTSNGREETWRSFRNDSKLIERYNVTDSELRVLKQVSLLGRVSSPRQYVYILNSIRQAVEEE